MASAIPRSPLGPKMDADNALHAGSSSPTVPPKRLNFKEAGNDENASPNVDRVRAAMADTKVSLVGLASPMTPSVNTVQAAKLPAPDFQTDNNVKVVCCVRPLSEKELLEGSSVCVQPVGRHTLAYVPSDSEAKNAMATPSRRASAQTPGPLRKLLSSVTPNGREKLREKLAKQSLGRDSQTFDFDSICDENASSQELFQVVGAPIVGAVAQGYNGTMFAYGLTGAGKTHTVGRLAPLVLDSVFGLLEQQALGKRELVASPTTAQVGTVMSHEVTASFVEIYNEKLSDLLDAPAVLGDADEPGSSQHGNAGGWDSSVGNHNQHGKDKARKLALRQGVSKEWHVEGLQEYPVANAEEALELFERGVAERRTAMTTHNSVSSRSHAIFTLTIQSRIMSANGSGQLRKSKLNLVDLAGSERQPKLGIGLGAKEANERCREAAGINKSLSTLQHCIKRLSEGASHVPFRDSSLTKLLSNALGGNACAVMVCNVGPALGTARETLSTLQFSQQARQVQNRPTINEESLTPEQVRGGNSEQVARMAADLAAARQLARVAEREVEQLQAQLAESKGHVVGLDMENASLRDESTLLKEENAAYKDQAAALGEQIHQAEEQVGRLQGSLQEERDRSAAMAIELEEAKAQLGALQEEMSRKCEEAAQALCKVTEDMNLEQAKAAELSKHLERSKDERRRLVDELEAAQTAKLELEQNIQEANVAAEAARSESQELCTALAAEMKKLASATNTTQSEADDLSEKLNASEAKRSAVTEQLRQAEEELARSAEAIQQLHDKLTSTQAEYDQLQGALARQQQEASAAKATAAKHVQNISTKYASLSKLLKEWEGEQ